MGNHDMHIVGVHKVTVDAEHTFEFLGHEVRFSKANSTDIVYGLKNEVFGGMRNSLTVGVVNDAFGGARNSATVGLSNDLYLGGRTSSFLGVDASSFVGLKLEATLSANLSIGASLNLGDHVLKLELAGLKVKQAGTNVELTAPRIMVAAIVIIA